MPSTMKEDQERLMKEHDADVAAVAARVKEFAAERRPFQLYHGSTNSTRRSSRRRDTTVDTSGLRRLLQVDPSAHTALVEPNVSMDVLVGATLAHRLVPPVVMELPAITVGGGFSGTSGESSSFRWGVFEQTVNWIEIVLATGEVTRASPMHKPDLFWAAASSFGTLGVVTMLEVKLVRARRYVELSYLLDGDVAGATETILRETAREDVDYVEGIVFRPDAAVTCVGRMVDEMPKGKKEQCFTERGDPWFYHHVETKVLPMLQAAAKSTALSKSSPTPSSGDEKAAAKQKVTAPEPMHDYVPLVDYLFRHDRGGFWASLCAFTYFHVPFNRVTRYLLDPLLHTRRMVSAFHRSGIMDSYIVQDVSVPTPRAPELASWLEEMNIYPLWLCPLLGRRDGSDAAHGMHAFMGRPDAAPQLINFGVWGELKTKDRMEMARANRALEAKVAELKGMKCLYAQAFYTEEEFWASSCYDRGAYDTVRERYGAAHLPSVYDKVKVDVEAEERAEREKGLLKRTALGVWPVKGLLGLYQAVKGGDYLLHEAKRGEKKLERGAIAKKGKGDAHVGEKRTISPKKEADKTADDGAGQEPKSQVPA